jgi:hypothetical protein
LWLFADGEDWSRHAMYVARLLKPWNEGEGLPSDGAPAMEGDVTFNSAQHGVMAWELPGAMGLTDVAEWESATMTGLDWPDWFVFDVTESIRDFLTTPPLNCGWKISQGGVRGEARPDISYCHGAYTYKSSEAPEKHLRPMLVLISGDESSEKTAQ